MSPEQRGPGERPINSPDPSPAEIREEIDATREALGDTVEALAEKTDVKAQAKAKAEEVKEAAPRSPAEAQALARRNPRPLAIAGGVLALLLLWRWRRR
ncbi:MAG TPA: DUF3618 domain-containing protein [Solirubrobacterales bacterium]